MNRKLICRGMAVMVWVFVSLEARGQYDLQNFQFTNVPASATQAGSSLDAVANNGTNFVCVGANNSPIFSVNTNRNGLNNYTGASGYLLDSSAWSKTLQSYYLNTVAFGSNWFITGGASNTVFISSNDIAWTPEGTVLPSSQNAYSVDGFAYNSVAGNFAAVLGIYLAAWTNNPAQVNPWPQANVVNSSFVESFRGVTSFGSTGMALCGIQGDIRVSPNGGATWNQGQEVNLNDPDLLAIASDGNNTLVCAGAYSTLEVSVNGGASWTYQTSLNLNPAPGQAAALQSSGTNFYSVTYSSSANCFMVAGIDGVVLMASNNPANASWTWTGTNVGTSTIYGASSANNGPFQGVTMLVGNSGTVIIGCTPPQAPTNAFGNYITNILTEPNQTNYVVGTNNSANIIADSMHPTNFITLDWYSAPSGGMLLAASSFDYQPTNTLYYLCGTYTNWAEARDLRTGFVSTHQTPFVFKIIPPAPINGASILTNVLTSSGTPISVSVLVNNGNPPANFEVNWYSTATGSNSLNFLNNGTETNQGNVFFHTPANIACGVYTNWAETMATNTSPAGVPVISTNRTAVTFVVIPAAPTLLANATNCALDGAYGMCANPSISVTVVTNSVNLSGRFTVNWYNSSGAQVASNTLVPGTDIATYTPLDSAPGTYDYYAETTNAATDFVSTNRTLVVFQVNAFPQWTNGPEFFTNTLTEPFQTNTVMTLFPAITNLFAITNVSNGAFVVMDWYTSPNPAVSTYENPSAPWAYGGVSDSSSTWGLPGGVKPGTGFGTFISTNLACGIYTYYTRARVVDTNFTECACQSINLVPVTFVLVPPAPTNAVTGITNVLNGSTQINTPIWVDILDNTDNPPANFVVNWYSTAEGSNSANFLNNGTETSVGNQFFHTPTNAACGIYTNWAETMATNLPGGIGLVSTNRIPVVFAVIPAEPTLVAPFAQTNCAGTPNPPFSVIVTNGQTAYWYATNSIVPLADTTTFIPTNSAPGIWMFSAQAVDPVTGLASTNTVTATLTLEACTNPFTISMNPTNGIGMVQWEGNLTLLSATNLTPPVAWQTVSNPSTFLPTNTLMWTNTSPPVQFFRLTN